MLFDGIQLPEKIGDRAVSRMPPAPKTKQAMVYSVTCPSYLFRACVSECLANGKDDPAVGIWLLGVAKVGIDVRQAEVETAKTVNRAQFPIGIRSCFRN